MKQLSGMALGFLRLCVDDETAFGYAFAIRGHPGQRVDFEAEKAQVQDFLAELVNLGYIEPAGWVAGTLRSWVGSPQELATRVREAVAQLDDPPRMEHPLWFVATKAGEAHIARVYPEDIENLEKRRASWASVRAKGSGSTLVE